MRWLSRLVGLAPLVAGACAADVISMGYDEPVKNQGLMPVGSVRMCLGACPYGECDNDEFFSQVDCDDVFPGPVDQNSVFCMPGDEGSYCLELGPDSLTTDTWVVHCGGGHATAEQCARGCSAGTSSAKCE